MTAINRVECGANSLLGKIPQKASNVASELMERVGEIGQSAAKAVGDESAMPRLLVGRALELLETKVMPRIKGMESTTVHVAKFATRFLLGFFLGTLIGTVGAVVHLSTALLVSIKDRSVSEYAKLQLKECVKDALSAFAFSFPVTAFAYAVAPKALGHSVYDIREEVYPA